MVPQGSGVSRRRRALRLRSERLAEVPSETEKSISEGKFGGDEVEISVKIPDSMLVPVTQLTPTQVEDLVKAKALSDTEYWVIEDADSDNELPPLIPVTSEFSHSITTFKPAPYVCLHSSLPPSPAFPPKLLPVLSSSPECPVSLVQPVFSSMSTASAPVPGLVC